GLNKDRGLSSLISDMDTVYSKELGFDKNQSTMIEIDQISPNPFQPRKNFDQEALDELANSIKEFGLIQPIIVFKKNNKFILIAGERRLRAVKALGKKEILAFIADIDENKLRELALIENIQRENLNPIELANSYKDLMQVHKITQENLAALYSPSKYGFIKELVGKDFLAMGNGVINAVSIVAILAGMALFSLSFESLYSSMYNQTDEILKEVAPLGIVLILFSCIEVFFAWRLPKLK
ncbi:ParB/RepB/Spo0J family partition protein, partial [Campylobacter jejuni]|uniref:ParB/RepB/Spo0J family partition protein n=1 Tax=Campylobacter jejuni TaxID=197 RepID=UPI00207493B6